MKFSRVFVLLSPVCLCTPALAADCPKPATIAELRQAGHDGETAFADMDSKALLRQVARAREDLLPCLSESLAPQDAAIFHRLMALEAFTRRNDARVLAEFHAARKLEPGYTFPPTVAEGDHPLLALYARAANIQDGRPEPIYAPENGYVLVGGVRNAPRMSAVPAIIQVYGAAGVWIETRYILPGEQLPIWGRNLFGVTLKDLGVDTTPTWKKPTGWYIAGGVSAALAITFYALALYEKSQFDDQATADSDLSGHRYRANGFGATAVSTAGLALAFTGLGIGFHVSFGGDESPEMQPIQIPTTSGVTGHE